MNISGNRAHMYIGLPIACFTLSLTIFIHYIYEQSMLEHLTTTYPAFLSTRKLVRNLETTGLG